MIRFSRAKICRPFALGAIVTALIGLAAGFFPLFHGPRYESALLSGLTVPMAAAIASAIGMRGRGSRPVLGFVYGVTTGTGLALVSYVVTLLHGVRAGFCDTAQGSVFFALGPLPGAMLGGVWGAFIAFITSTARGGHSLFGRRWFVAAGAMVGPLAGIAVSIFRFYSSPMVFAYDPFVGYFSGTLYDTVVDWKGLLSYRAGSALTLVALLSGAALVEARRRSVDRPNKALAVLFVASVGASLVHTGSGPRLGHYHTSRSIREALGGHVSGARCDVFFSQSIAPAEISRFTRECSAHVAAVERYLGVESAARVTAYLFANAGEKAALMGAAHTQIAKPWRGEIYVQSAGYPHPVLGHEIAHVIAAQFGHGPFRIAGSLGGLLPNPGLIEGLAVAASPKDGDLGPGEWAASMRRLKLLPPVRRLFALGFLGENSALAYTVSGAFVQFVRDQYGAQAVQKWYGGAALESLTGETEQNIEERWHRTLDALPLSEAGLAEAKRKFDRPSIFARRCPREVDACTDRAEDLRQSGNDEAALVEYERAGSLDPESRGIEVAKARTLLRLGRFGEAESMLEAVLADATAAPHERERAMNELGDWAFASGQDRRAAEIYERLRGRAVDEAELRTLDVKLYALQSAEGREAIQELLVGSVTSEEPHIARSPDKTRAAELLSRWDALAPNEGLAAYLLSRQAFTQGRFVDALRALTLASEKRIDLERVKTEVNRLGAIAACGLGDVKGAQGFFERYQLRPVSPTRKQNMKALLERCSGYEGAP